MQTSLAKSLVVVAALACAVPARAADPIDYHLLFGADLLGTNVAGSTATAALELGLQAHADVRRVGGRWDFRLDFQDREGFFGNPSRHELRELWAAVRNLGGAVDITFGRLAVPGGFWLFVDGADVRVQLPRNVWVRAFGGLRGVTNGRTEADLRTSPLLLPLGGAAVGIDNPYISGSLAYTYTYDSIEAPVGNTVNDGSDYSDDGSTATTQTVRTTKTQEQFLDARLFIVPHRTLTITSGLSLGSRYELSYGALPSELAQGPLVTATPLRAFSAYAVFEYQPWKRLRVSYALDYKTIRLLTTVGIADPTTPADSGTFQDHLFKIRYKVWRGLRAEARYRLRIRDGQSPIHRVEGGLSGESLWHGLGGFVTFSVDVYPGAQPQSPGLIRQDVYAVSGGLSFSHRFVDVRAGVLYTDSIESPITLSTHAAAALGGGPTAELFPTALESQRIAFVRAFAVYKNFFGGLDLEASLGVAQLRGFAQLGYAR